METEYKNLTMTLGEFRSFIEGMDIQGAPTEDQWKKIQEKLATLSPEYINQPLLPSYPSYPQYRWAEPQPYYPITCSNTY